jgi:ribosomal protein S10
LRKISPEARLRATRRLLAIDLMVRGEPEREKPRAEPEKLAEEIRLFISQAEQAERRTAVLADDLSDLVVARLGELEGRAVVAQVGLARVRGRRLYRLADVVVAWVRRPWRVGRLVVGLRSASRRVGAPSVPELSDWRKWVSKAVPQSRRGLVGERPLPYPHLRVAHVGGLRSFDGVAALFPLAEVDLDVELQTGFDMLLIEPGVDDSLAEIKSETLHRFRDARIPILLFVRMSSHLEHSWVDEVDVVVTDDDGLAEQARDRHLEVLQIAPSTDDRVYNPVGWRRQPEHGLLVIADQSGTAEEIEHLRPVAEQTTLYGQPLISITPASSHPNRPLGADLAEIARHHTAAYISPNLTVSRPAYIQLVLDIAATGTPVITPPDPEIATLLGHHPHQAATATPLQHHLDQLADPLHRERLSVTVRRHIHTHHTRRHRFEQLLHHLDIPTNPTPKISILLATKRPENLEHALNNVTAQTWPNKELLLILHGADQFDTNHIQQLTNTLPYPTQIIPCPDTWTLGDCLNAGLDQANGTYITKMDDDDHYGPHHLTDLHTAHTYSNAPITGKWAAHAYVGQFDFTASRMTAGAERFVDHVAGPTLFATRNVALAVRFLRVRRRVDTTFLSRARDLGLQIFRTHPFGLVMHREQSGHTWDLNGYGRWTSNAVSVERGLSQTALDSELEAPDEIKQDHLPPAPSPRAQDLMGLRIRLKNHLTLDPIDLVVARLGELEGRAVVAEVGLARVRGRRLYRLADVVVAWVRRPWRVGRLVVGLRSASRRVGAPSVPELSDWRKWVSKAVPQSRRGLVGERPLPYPHLRVAHVGGLRSFDGVAALFPLDEVDLDVELQTGFDMLLIEPGVDDSLAEIKSETLHRFRDARIPILLFVRMSSHLEHSWVDEVDVVVTDDDGLAEQARDRHLEVLQIAPSTDDRVYNPVGWRRQPEHGLLVIADQSGTAEEIEHLRPVAEQTTLYGQPLISITPASSHPNRPLGADLAEIARHHTAAYISPNLTVSRPAYIQLVLDIAATGTPVITPPDPEIATLLGHHPHQAATATPLQHHLDQLADPLHRERLSVTVRRHIHTHHTRRHRFEQLLHHLDIPTNPTPKISILLATKRPENLEHALNNVTAQTWPNKELLLILHGADQFDTNHIQQLTNTLPYPTQIIPCPDTWTLGDCLNAGLDQANGTYITKMDDDDHYGPHHLTDLHTAHTYSNATITGKWSNVVYLSSFDLTLDWRVEFEEKFGSHIPGATMLGERDAVRSYRFARVQRNVDGSLWIRMRSDGRSLYSTHRFNFVRIRGGDHTFQRGDEAFVGNSTGHFLSGLDLSHAYI